MDNRDHRRKLDDELAQYKQKLASYQEGQQRQSNLVQRLQTKVSFSEIGVKLKWLNFVP